MSQYPTLPASERNQAAALSVELLRDNPHLKPSECLRMACRMIAAKPSDPEKGE